MNGTLGALWAQGGSTPTFGVGRREAGRLPGGGDTGGFRKEDVKGSLRQKGGREQVPRGLSEHKIDS